MRPATAVAVVPLLQDLVVTVVVPVTVIPTVTVVRVRIDIIVKAAAMPAVTTQ